jgi:predicted nucleic acid-binding protein
MAREVFVDSAGLYALADHRDPARAAALACVSDLLRSGRRLILTDYIIDEAATLAKTRGGSSGALRLLEIVDRSDGFHIEWIGAARFDATKAFFRKHADRGYSFTDCTSFVVMRELGLKDALTTDRHFAEAGFTVLLPVA